MADVNANIGVNIDTSAALAQLKALQRQISQFHTSIAKSSETATLAQRDLQKNFLNSVNAIGAFSAELRTVKTTSESFTDSLQKNKFSMREYFRYAGASTKTFGKLFKSEFDTIGKVADDRVKRLQTQYIKLGRDTSGVMKAIAIMPNQLDMGNFSTQAQIAAQKQAIFNQLVKQGSTNLLNFGKNTQWAGRQLMVGFTLPLATLGTVATRTFMEMEQATIKFRKVYGDLFTPTEETTQALDNITALGQMFTQYGIAVSQTVGLAAEAAAAGFSGVDLQRQTTEATRLSILGQVDAQKALETTISLQNAFRMSSDQLASSIDFLNAVENQTVVSLDDITTAIPKVAPVIEQLGGDVKDLAFFMAAMKEGGINASEGANALKSGLAALINPTEKASAMLAGYGINIKKIIEGNQGDLKTTVVEFAQALDTLDPLTRARAIEQLFGKFQFARLSTLFTNVINETGQASRVLDLAGTSIEDLAALSESELGMTADSAMNKFKKSVEDLKFALVPVGQTFMEAVTPIVEFLGGILERFNNLSTGVKKAIVVLTVAIGAIGPIALMTFGLLANGLANIVKGALVLRNGYLRLTGQTQVLGEQTEYLTMEQIDAAAASHSLDQSHAKLTQTFTAESSAVAQLIAAYQQATAAAAKFAAVNPGMMRAPGTPTKRAKGKPIVVGGTGNQDTELALLTPGETVIPAEMSKRYGALINGMIAGNIPGYKTGRGSLGTGDAEFAQSIAAGASLRSQSKIREFLERELKAVPEALVEDFKSLVTTASQEIQLSEKSLKERLKAFRAQYNANIGQQEELQFAHLDTGRRVKAGELQESGAVVDPKTQARLKTFIDAAGADALVDLKTGFGVELTGFLNNAMQGAGASLEDAIADFKIGGVDKFRKSVEMGGGNMEDLGPELAAFDARFQQNLEEAYSQGARIIVDSQAQIEQMRQEALAKGETFDDTIYVAMDTVAEQTRQNVLELGSGLDAVFEEAKNRITEIRFQGLTPEQNAALPAGFSRGSKGGRITPGSTSYGRGKKVVGSFRNAPLAQESVANVDAAIAATAQAAGTASPSKKTIPIGEDIARGLEVGMANQQDEVAMAGQELGAAAVSGTQSGRRAAFRAQGPAGTDEPTQSGGPRVRRRADRPQAPADLTLEQARQSAISPAMKDAIDQEVTARKTSAQRIDSMNKGLMAGTFALTSLAGAGSMASGPIGNLSQQVMKYSGLLFALMSITQLLTQAKFAELVATRAKTVADVMGSKTVGGLFSRGGGLAGFGKNLLTAGKFLLRFAGPIGLVTTGLLGLYSITKMINAAREKERQKLEAFSDVITVSTDKLKFLSEQFNFIPVKGSLETFGKDLERTSVEVRTAREQLKESEGFQQTYGQNIEQVRGMSDQQAETALSFMGLDLISQGMAKEQVQLLIDTIKEEAGKKDLKFDFKSITFDEKGLSGLNTQFDTSIKEFAATAQKGFEKIFVYQASGTGRDAQTKLVERLVPNAEAKAAIKNAGKLVGSYAESLNRLATSGSIGMEELTKITDSMFASISESAPDASMQIRIFNATLNAIDPALSKAVKGVKDLKDMQLLLKAAIAGVSANLIANAALAFRTAEALNKVAAANLLAFGVKDTTADQAATRGFANNAAVDARILLNKAMKEALELSKELNKVDGTIGGASGEGSKSAFQLAIEQLQKQQLELKNTKIAYDMLKKAGFDAATATKYASDSVIALGLATGKISTDQIEQVKTLMTDIEKRAGSEAIKNFLDSLGTENKLKESLLGIVPTLLAMGATTKDIENILGNSELTKSFVDPLATAEQKAERIQKYLDAVRKGEAIDIKFNVIINPDAAKEELKKKADELFGFLERAAQREYKPKILDAEKEVKNAQAVVDGVQAEIDSIQKGIDKEQRKIELEITRPIEDMQEEISDLQRGIELEFERPLAALSDESSLLSEQLVFIDKAAESINSKYDAQAEALTKVSEINSDIINQQKQQLGLADALTQGDISAAANAAQEMRASQAEASAKNAGDIIQAARDAELAGLRSPISGLTRKQIEDRQFQIERETFNLNLRRKDVDEKILAIQDKIYLLEEDREKRVRAIRLEEDKIYEITNKKLVTAQKQLDVAQKNLDKVKEELQARLDDIDAQRDAWQAAADAEIAAAIAAGDYNDVISQTINYLNDVLNLWKKIASAASNASNKLSATNAYVAPTSTAADEAALEEFISIVEELDAALAALDAAEASGNMYAVRNAGIRLAAAQAAYDATLPVVDPSMGSNGRIGGGSTDLQYMASGGMVSPKYFAAGGLSRGSDTVPAMLTPGEFVVNKNATKKFGPLLSSLNRGQYPGVMSQGKFGISSNSQSFISPSYSVVSPTTISSPSTNVAAPSYNNNSNTVYNYSVGINVGGSNVNPDSIAKAVLGEIRYIDSQRIRGQR
jgi:TP901 family phage tail tape measure protein